MLLAASFVVNLVGGVAFVLVGALLLALRPARAGAIGFAAFALVSGGQHIFGNLGSIFFDAPAGSLLLATRVPFLLLAPGAIVWAAARYRGPSARVAYPFFALAAVTAVCLIVVPERLLTPRATNLPLAEVLITAPYFAGLAVAVGLLAATLRAERSEALRTEVALLLLATAPPLGYTSAFSLMILARAPALFPPAVAVALASAFVAGIVATAFACAALFVAPIRRGRPVALLVAALVAAGALQGSFAIEVAQFGGLLRIAAALLLGYALLKFRVFDIDVKVRDTLAAGMMAGIAVVGFFIASELAETFVADRTGSTALALAVAAGLLLLEARVTHAGKRLARRALPRVEDELATRRFDVYRTAYESAAKDGVLSERERGILRILAEELGLSQDQTAHLELTATRSAA